MAAGMTIKCPMCGEVLPVAVDVVTKDTITGTILARLDTTAADPWSTQYATNGPAPF